MNPKKVSIVVISYNQGKYLRECLESIFAQTYHDKEVIVIDNFSSDSDSYEIAKELIPAFDAKLIRREDRSLTKCLNNALDLITGEYVCFIAADDYMVHNRIAIQTKYLSESGKEVAACFGNQIRISEENELLGCSKIVRQESFDFNDIFTKRSDLYAPSAMYKVEALRNIGGYSELHKIEDLSIYLKLTKHGYTLVTLPYTFAFYRIHNNNTHTKYKWMMEEKLRIWKDYEAEKKYPAAIQNIFLEHFSNFGSTNKIECLKLLKNIWYRFDSKYFWFGLIRLFFDFRSI